MLNKYTLNFLYQEQTDNYIRKNSPKIIKEHLNFTIYALAFAVICVIQFLLSESYILAILASLSIVLILFMQKMLSRKPQYINFVITFYQFFVLLVVSINVFLPTEKPSQQFAWSYGFQISFMHFCLYLQATDMIWSTIIMFTVITIHFITFTYDPQYTFTHLINFIFTFICMVAVKYRKSIYFNFTIMKKEKRKSFFIPISKNNGIGQLGNPYQIQLYQLGMMRNKINSGQLNKVQNPNTLIEQRIAMI